MKKPEVMTDEQLLECKQFLDYFRVKYDGKVIEINSGGNGMVFRTDGKFSENFVGCSINSIAEAVARKLGKKIQREQEY